MQNRSRYPPITMFNHQENSSMFRNETLTDPCLEMPVYDENKTFCGVDTTWTPRISQSSAITACVVPSVFAWLFTLPVIYHVKRKLGCKVLLLLKILWDAIDVTLDAILFYQLEMGIVLDKNIIRNHHVSNAILGFAAFGCIKISFWFVWNLYSFNRSKNFTGWKWTAQDGTNIKLTDPTFDSDLDDHRRRWKHYMAMFTFYFEDGPELILEYFYIEKYVTVQPPWYLLVKDVVIPLLALYKVFDIMLVDYYRRKQYKECNITINVLLIGTLMFIRVGAAGYQYVTGKLRRACLEVDNKNLVQAPFASGCLREVDYVIIVFSVILLLMLVRNIQYVCNYYVRYYYPWQLVPKK